MKKYFEVILLMLVISFVAISKSRPQKEDQYVILVSFDGFRHDYVDMYNTPNFKNFIKGGVSAEAMWPSYPSKTFPNHYTLVTGLYPPNHGLVDNSFYAPDLDKTYVTRNRELVENPNFYGGLPLWQLAQKNGMKSASFFWVGSEAPVAGSFPDYYKIYDGSIKNEDRITQVANWLKLSKEDRPRFISLYFSLVDSQGHATGPYAPETGKTVEDADRLLGLLIEAVSKIDLPINVVLVADHGMNEIKPEAESYMAIERLSNGLEKEKVQLVNNGAHAHFYLKDKAYGAEVYNHLDSIKGTKFELFRKETTPENWQFRSSDRVGDIFIKMNPGHYISSNRRIRFAIENEITNGQHGFDPKDTKDMGAIFYAKGPAFKTGLEISPFENIHVYPMIAEILGIKELPNIDGDLNVLKAILK